MMLPFGMELPFLIILFGPPGSGKGTLGTPLASRLGVPLVTTGAIFREEIRQKTPLGSLAKSYIDQGELVPDEVTLEMLFSRLCQKDCQEGCLLDGFPRTVSQSRALDEQMGQTAIRLLHLQVRQELLIRRIGGRLSCSGCGKPWHRYFDPPREKGQCDACFSPLYQREDDREDVVLKRLAVYREQTAPILDHYAGLVQEMDGAGKPEEVLKEALQWIESSGLPVSKALFHGA
jgi:adenylate kinase